MKGYLERDSPLKMEKYMRYTYDSYSIDTNLIGVNRRYDTTTRVEEVGVSAVKEPNFVCVTDNLTEKQVAVLRSPKELYEWIGQLEHGEAIKSEHEESIRNEQVAPGLRDILNTFSSDVPVKVIRKKEKAWDPFDERETDIHISEAPKHHKLEIGPEDPIKAAVDPAHYKTYFILDEDTCLQWIDTQSRIQRFRNPELFKAAIELQIRKYLDRNGSKDVELQELSKALWYLKYLVAYIKNGDQPVRVEDVEKILSK